MTEISYRARVRELSGQVHELKRDNEHAERTIAMFESDLKTTENAAVAMERDRDELLETVNRHGLTPLGELEEQIRLLKLRLEAKEEDFEHLDVLADGYKAQRDTARAELLGEELSDTQILDLTNEEAGPGALPGTKPVTLTQPGEEIVPFHREKSGKLVAGHGPGLIGDHRRVTEERDDARRARDLTQCECNRLTEQLTYWENVAPNTHPELIVSTLMEERDALQSELDKAENRAETIRLEGLRIRRFAELGLADARNSNKSLRAVITDLHEVKQERDGNAESVRFNVERVTDLAEELSEVKAQRNDKDVVIDAMTANAETLKEDADRAWAALELSEEKLVATETALELAIKKLATLDTPEPDPDPDDDPEDDPTSPTGGAGGGDGSTGGSPLRDAIAERSEAIAAEQVAAAGSPLKIKTLAGPGPRIESDEAAPEAPEKPTTPGARLPVDAPPLDKFGDGFVCRLGYDYGEEIFFDRSRPVEGELHADGGPLYEECEPTDVVADLEHLLGETQIGLNAASAENTDLHVEITDQQGTIADLRETIDTYEVMEEERAASLYAQVADAENDRERLHESLVIQKALTEDRLAEQRLLQRELRAAERKCDAYQLEVITSDGILNTAVTELSEERSKTAHLRSRLHQAIKHIDDITAAICDDTPTPPRPGGLIDADDDDEEESEAEARAMLAHYRTQFVRLAETKLALEKQVDELQAKLAPESSRIELDEQASRDDFQGIPRGPTDESLGTVIADAVLDNVVEVSRESIETGTRDATFAEQVTGDAEEEAGPTKLHDRHKVVATAMDILKRAKSREPRKRESAGMENAAAKLGITPEKVVEVGVSLLEAAPAQERIVTVDDIAEAIGAKIVMPETKMTITGSVAEMDANASACTRVWIAPAGACPALVSDSHGFAERAPAPGFFPAPYCPACNQDFVAGERPVDPDRAYVTVEESRRMTGS